MNEIYIDIRNENEWIKKYFDNKDLVTISELLDVIEELDSDIANLKMQIEDMENNIKDNYKPVSPYEKYGIDEDNFH